MPELSRSQALVYAAVAVALLLVGTRAIRADVGDGSAFTLPSGGAGSVGTSASGDAADGGDALGFSIESGGADVIVDVTGAVRRSGVYRLPVGARVVDAIARAGGPRRGALLEGINRAARLTDGQQVVVPERGPAGPAGTAAAGVVGAVGAEAGPISLGTATVEQLDTIEGIGPVTAQKILEYRDQHSGLGSVEQLDEVSGIGPATMESLRSRLQP